MATYTTENEFRQGYDQLFQTFASGKTKDLAWRKWQLKQCWWMIVDNEKRIEEALHEDLNRHVMESQMADISATKADILEHLKHLEEWAADEIPDAGFFFKKVGGARIRNEPLGVAMIIGAWNFPILLVMQPVIAAITAGCCMMVKPSELAEASQTILVELFAKYLDRSAIRIVTGGPGETSKFLEYKFNHVFFTGSAKVARYITAAAAKHLTPTVLELGGQGPAIVTKTANIDLAAKRIAAAKFLNGGQICLNINHVFVDPPIKTQFLARLQFWLDKFMANKEQFTTIVNERNYDRLASLLESSDGKVLYSGENSREKKFMHPTIITDLKVNDSLFSDELFGPLLPTLDCDYREACKIIAKMSQHPLAIYIFSGSKQEIDYVLDNTLSGGVTINDAFLHPAIPNTPFGGVGDSGYGSYHGKYGFMAFTHQRAVIGFPNWLDSVMSFKYPPYDLKNLSKIVVAQSIKFKRGETIKDQKIGKGSTLWGLVKTASTLVAVVGVMYRHGFLDKFRKSLL